MSKRDVEQQLEDLYRELSMYTRQMDEEGVSSTRQKIVELERTLNQICS